MDVVRQKQIKQQTSFSICMLFLMKYKNINRTKICYDDGDCDDDGDGDDDDDDEWS